MFLAKSFVRDIQSHGTVRSTFLTELLLRLHAQALTLAALAGAAVVEYYDHKTEATNRYPKFLPPENLSHKD